MKKIIFISILTAIFVIIAIFIDSHNYIKIAALAHSSDLRNNFYANKQFQDEESDNLTPRFEYFLEDCRNIINECQNKDVGIINALWADKKSLVVETYVNINCGKSIVTMSYDLKDDTLTLMYYVKFMRTEINTCKYKLLYKLSNFVKKDYKIILKEIDASGRCGTPPPAK